MRHDPGRLWWCLLLAGFVVPASGADRYGAIAYSPITGHYGQANNQPDRVFARQQARMDCEQRSPQGECADILWFREACGALAVGADYAYGAAWDTERAQAEEEARANCASWGRSCEIQQSFCVGDPSPAAAPLSLAPPEVEYLPPSPSLSPMNRVPFWPITLILVLVAVVLASLAAARLRNKHNLKLAPSMAFKNSLFTLEKVKQVKQKLRPLKRPKATAAERSERRRLMVPQRRNVVQDMVPERRRMRERRFRHER